MNKTHGVVSIIFFVISQFLALTALFVKSNLLGLGYSVVFMIAVLGIVYSYCAKCPARLTNCGHVIIGPVTRIFPERPQGPYSKRDYAITVSALAVLILLPQLWLWDQPKFLLSFWGLLIIAGIQINLYVCTKCDNHQCIACKNKKPLN